MAWNQSRQMCEQLHNGLHAEGVCPSKVRDVPHHFSMKESERMSGIRILSKAEIQMIGGGMINLGNTPGYRGPKLMKGGTVGAGDTIDGIPWGGSPGDGSWGIVNNNLPGGGPWGN
jgi:hypothetical protein